MTGSVPTLQEYFRHLRMSETADELPMLLRNAENRPGLIWSFYKSF